MGAARGHQHRQGADPCRCQRELKAEGKCPTQTSHRQVKYRNNEVETDHGRLKQLIGSARGFKTLKTACATIKGFAVMRAVRKGQAGAFVLEGGIVGEARLVERAFGLGPCALTVVVALLQDRPVNAESRSKHDSPLDHTSPLRQVCNRALAWKTPPSLPPPRRQIVWAPIKMR